MIKLFCEIEDAIRAHIKKFGVTAQVKAARAALAALKELLK